MLAGILTYHVVAGNMNAAAMAKAIKAGGGAAELITVNGGTLWAMIHVIDKVLMPAK